MAPVREALANSSKRIFDSLLSGRHIASLSHLAFPCRDFPGIVRMYSDRNACL